MVLSEDCTIDKVSIGISFNGVLIVRQLENWGIDTTPCLTSSLHFLRPSWLVEYIKTKKRPDLQSHLHRHVSMASIRPPSDAMPQPMSLPVKGPESVGAGQESLFASPQRGRCTDSHDGGRLPAPVPPEEELHHDAPCPPLPPVHVGRQRYNRVEEGARGIVWMSRGLTNDEEKDSQDREVPLLRLAPHPTQVPLVSS